MAEHKRSELNFWDCNIDKFRRAVEKEVYKAIKELLVKDNPDFLLWTFEIDSSNEPFLHLHVDGRKRPDIELKFTLDELVTDFLDGREGADGTVYLDKDERNILAKMQSALEAQAERVKSFIARAKDREENS